MSVTRASTSRPLVTVIIPAYNEELTIEPSLTVVYRYLQSLTGQYPSELLVVDDGSTDRTRAIADGFAAAHPGVRVLYHEVNYRLGHALRHAFALSRGDYVVVFDADLSYSVDHIGRMLDTIRREHARIVLASPYMAGGGTTAVPRHREAMSRGVNRLLAMTAQGSLHTLTGMVRCYEGPFVRSLDLRSMGPEINTEILYKAQIMRSRIVEMPAHLDWTDQEERARTRKVSLRVSTTSKLLMFSSFLFRPIYWFLIPGLIVLAVAAWTLGGVAWLVAQALDEQTRGGVDHRVTQAFVTAYEARPHSFIVGGFSLVIGVQLLSLGLLATQSKRYFEDMFHLGTGLALRLDRLEHGDTGGVRPPLADADRDAEVIPPDEGPEATSRAG